MSVDPLTIKCTFCNAAPGSVCKNIDTGAPRDPRDPHYVRKDAAAVAEKFGTTAGEPFDAAKFLTARMGVPASVVMSDFVREMAEQLADIRAQIGQALAKAGGTDVELLNRVAVLESLVAKTTTQPKRPDATGQRCYCGTPMPAGRYDCFSCGVCGRVTPVR